jgi:enoyl-CoA hydratase/carnithine racemase
MAQALFNLEVPMIAAINGHAIGAGLDLACMCDIRIASKSAKMASSFIKVGIIPGDGGAWLLPRVVGVSRAAELMLTGKMIDAQQALDWNLVSQVVEPGQLMQVAHELAASIAQHSSHGVRLTKRLLRESLRAPFDTVLELSAAYQTVSHKTADHAEAVDAFLEKRAPRYS